MSNLYEFKLPAMGEGIDGGDVVSMAVSVGDQVAESQTVCELETSKALIEVPCDAAGTVDQIMFKVGDAIEVGAVILMLSGVADQPQQLEATVSEQAGEQPAVQADTQPQPSQPTRPPARQPQPKLDKLQRPQGESAPAAPATRLLARELGVNVGAVTGSGHEGRITKEDVKQFVRGAMSGAGGTNIEPALPDYSNWGPVERIRPNKVKSLTASHMAMSWNTIPLVTQFEQVDITELELLRRQLDTEVRSLGGRLTLTVILMKVLVPALRKFPMFNSSRDPQTGELVFKHFYNIGIATATDRGLLVPVIQAVDRKSMLDLSQELGDMATRARHGKIQLAELSGGTFSISNQGSIGGGHFTPIVNHPEAAILAVGRSRTVPGYVPGTTAGQVTRRLQLPLAVSYDHRIIDGAEAAGFIRMLQESLEDPGRLLLGL